MHGVPITPPASGGSNNTAISADAPVPPPGLAIASEVAPQRAATRGQLHPVIDAKGELEAGNNDALGALELRDTEMENPDARV